MTAICKHPTLHCLNQHELIRKYRCASCDEIMMCGCDEEFGRRFLSHQLTQGVELETQARVPVTLGFQPKTCRECRGLPAEAAPKAKMPGHTSKIRRYYWRELFFETTIRTANWDDQHPTASGEEREAAHRAVTRDVLDAIKAQHDLSPKYVFTERSQAEVLKRYEVQVIALRANYVDDGKKGALIRGVAGTAISAETFAERHFESDGWTALRLESRPFQCSFATPCISSSLIQTIRT